MNVFYGGLLVVMAALAVLWVCWLCHYRKHHRGISPLYMAFGVVALQIFILTMAVHCQTLRPGDAALLSILDVLRYFTMNVDFAPLEFEAALWIYRCYQTMAILLSLLAPVCTVTFLFSLFKVMLRRAKLTLQRKRPVYYFSELNEKSYTLALSLHRQWQRGRGGRKPCLVFCQVDSSNENDTELQFRADAEAFGAVFYKDPVHAIHLCDATRRAVRIFLMDENEGNNILTLLKMQDRLYRPWEPRESEKKPPAPISDLFVFSTLESSEMLFDKLLTDASKAPKNRRAPVYNLHMVDETELVAQKLLLDHPLFEAVQHPGAGDAISVLVVGGGRLGMEIVRTAMICGVTDSYSFDIQVIDRNAKVMEEQFRHSYPYLFRHPELAQSPEAGVDIQVCPKFYEADVETAGFDRVLTEHCNSCNYIVITTGDDELNMITAQFLQRWYARQDIANGHAPSRPPVIFTAIRNAERYDALKALENDQLFLFGRNTDIFSPEGILDRPLDGVSSVFNSCYDYANTELSMTRLCTPDEADRKQMKQDFFLLPLSSQLSNQMVALHSIYKLQDLLHMAGKPTALLDYRKERKDTQAFFTQLARLMDGRRDMLHRLEHRRWNVAAVLDGFEPFPAHMIRVCREEGDPAQDYHKHRTAGLHGCIIPFEELTPLNQWINDWVREKKGSGGKDFLSYDMAMSFTSLFAWLDLEADPEEAGALRDSLLVSARRSQGCAAPVIACRDFVPFLCRLLEPQYR